MKRNCNLFSSSIITACFYLFCISERNLTQAIFSFLSDCSGAVAMGGAFFTNVIIKDE
jgi:hypothetical protein